MRSLEEDLALDTLSNIETDALCAAVLLTVLRPDFSAPDIVNHDLLKRSGRATIYRAISTLEAAGYFVPYDEGPKNSYTLNLER